MINNKFWQAFFALAPILLGLISVIVYIFFVINLVTDIQEVESMGQDPSAQMILGNIAWFMGFIIFLILTGLGSLIFYIVHAVQNPNLKGNNMLIVWIILFFFFGGISQVIYWIVEIIGKRNQITTS
ncbi:hypothetical protein [Croceivirga thetidis]|uniref:DUF4064 domain-containing protein n=1 Tax=Croceivirga thetidis TaxID=2721623 RepID=A0ABX1GSY1_9FLAO|nr:hypothetical protein [Croceivirga thetidis]NKI32748.1 hypothetical protein [Croceivirga thetidis]